MTKASIPRSLRHRVLAESGGQCAYCHSLVSITGARPVIDHIIPLAAGGQTRFDNLCLACHSCNEFKAARVQAQDPVTGEQVRLFHPHALRWNDHFRWTSDGTKIVGVGPIARATVSTLNMNHPIIVEARRRWVAVGWHPPDDDV